MDIERKQQLDETQQKCIMQQALVNFRSLNSTLHIVLSIGEQALFDFLPDTLELRPYNSCNWYRVNPENYQNIISYILDIHQAFLLPDETDDNNCDRDMLIGYKVNDIILIDLIKVINHLSNITDIITEDNLQEINMEEFEQETFQIIHDCNRFMNAILPLFDRGDCILTKQLVI